MKKLAAVVCLLMVTQCSFAYIKEGETANIKNLQGKGYSQSTLKIMDSCQKRANNGAVDEQYTPYYENPYYGTKNAGWWYERIKGYFDPAQDDRIFGEHEINFDNKFFQDQPSMTKVEDL